MKMAIYWEKHKYKSKNMGKEIQLFSKANTIL